MGRIPSFLGKRENVGVSVRLLGLITGLMVLAGCGGAHSTSSTSTTTSSSSADTATLSVNLGPTGNYTNGIFTSVTVCAPGSTTSCTTIPDVLVDTGSVGLRVLGSNAENVSASQVVNLGLTQITDPSSGEPEYECVQYGDLSYTWGPVQLATVTVGGETSSHLPGIAANTGIPIQVITTAAPPQTIQYGTGTADNPCLTYPNTNDTVFSGGADDDTVAALLGANGILGIGNFPQDCVTASTNYCSSEVTGMYMGYDADTGGGIVEGATPVGDQAWNFVSALPADNNGTQVSLPSVAANGAATASGTLTFGIGTESNNGMSSQAIYELDEDGNFATASYNSITYTSTNSGGTFIDSGSNALYVSDAGTLGTTDCASADFADFYCPTSTLNLLPLGLAGYNSTSTSVSLVIANTESLVGTGSAAFDDLGGPSCISSSTSPCSPATDYWDLGLPFFFGRPLYVGISEGTAYPNGYWAF